MNLYSVQKKNFDKPDKEFKAGRSIISVVDLGGATHRRIVFEPGWNWSTDVEPADESGLCSLWHVFVHVSGKFRVKMMEGEVFEFGPGDVSVIPPGHDAWTIGDEPAIVIDHTPAELAVNK